MCGTFNRPLLRVARLGLPLIDMSLSAHAPDVATQYRTGLFMITSICGLIDAVCFLTLGGVFAEMMTGNILLLALTLGAGTFFGGVSHYITAIAAFTMGAFVGGYLVNSARENNRYQRVGFVVEWAVLVAATVLAFSTTPEPNNWAGIALVVM